MPIDEAGEEESREDGLHGSGSEDTGSEESHSGSSGVGSNESLGSSGAVSSEDGLVAVSGASGSSSSTDSNTSNGCREAVMFHMSESGSGSGEGEPNEHDLQLQDALQDASMNMQVSPVGTASAQHADSRYLTHSTGVLPRSKQGSSSSQQAGAGMPLPGPGLNAGSGSDSRGSSAGSAGSIDHELTRPRSWAMGGIYPDSVHLPVDGRVVVGAGSKSGSGSDDEKKASTHMSESPDAVTTELLGGIQQQASSHAQHTQPQSTHVPLSALVGPIDKAPSLVVKAVSALSHSQQHRPDAVSPAASGASGSAGSPGGRNPAGQSGGSFFGGLWPTFGIPLQK